MTLADLPWIFSDQRPHGVLTYDADEVDWLDADGVSPLGVTQEVTIGAEFEVTFVIPGNVEPTSDLLDSALPDLSLWLAYGFDTIPSELVFTPSDDTPEHDITASWQGDEPAAYEGFDDTAAALGWTAEQIAEVRTWIEATVDLARRLRPHIELTGGRIEEDIANGLTLSMPFGDNEFLHGGLLATVLLATDTEDDDLVPEAVADLGIPGARAWAAVNTEFPSAYLTEACGYFGFDVVE